MDEKIKDVIVFKKLAYDNFIDIILKEHTSKHEQEIKSCFRYEYTENVCFANIVYPLDAEWIEENV